MVIVGLITSPLLAEDWFSWRLWAVFSVFCTIRYYLYFIAQQNNLTLTKSILMKLDKLTNR